MDLDRQTIEKKDFPIGRRGYDADAVDAHLATVAREIETLQRSHRAALAQQPQGGTSSGGGESLATAAAMQVQAIVEAAESTAGDIRRQAEDDASRTRHDAAEAAARTRDDAIGRAQSHVDGVSKAAAVMLQRVAAMESELGALVQSLRTGADRLNADLALLTNNMGDLYDAAGSTQAPSSAVASAPAPPAFTPAQPAFTPAPEPPLAAAPEPDPDPEPEQFAPLGAPADNGEPVAAPFAQQTLASEPPAAGPGGASPDIAGARMIALNMALNGQPREEADRYLADNFDIPNRQALIDDVYSALDG